MNQAIAFGIIIGLLVTALYLLAFKASGGEFRYCENVYVDTDLGIERKTICGK